METKENKIWILFANGESSRVNLSLHQGKNDRNRPADGYVVTGGGLSRSVRRAAEAVYNWLQQTGHNPDQFVAGFDVHGADSSMVGESGGLSFAVALAARLLNKENISVAATGEIAGGHFPGPLAAIDAINDKFSGAVVQIPAGSILLYPSLNDSDIEPGLRSQLEQKNIRLYAVSTVAEALEIVFDQEKQPFPASDTVAPASFFEKLPVLLTAAVVVFCVAAAILWKQGEQKAAAYEEPIAVEIPSSTDALSIKTSIEMIPEEPEELPSDSLPVETAAPDNRGFD